MIKLWVLTVISWIVVDRALGVDKLQIGDQCIR